MNEAEEAEKDKAVKTINRRKEKVKELEDKIDGLEKSQANISELIRQKTDSLKLYSKTESK